MEFKPLWRPLAETVVAFLDEVAHLLAQHLYGACGIALGADADGIGLLDFQQAGNHLEISSDIAVVHWHYAQIFLLS
ncbi:MAG: hypothetical protein ACU88J_12710 [Gammaproteobacteria bacterium]